MLLVSASLLSFYLKNILDIAPWDFFVVLAIHLVISLIIFFLCFYHFGIVRRYIGYFILTVLMFASHEVDITKFFQEPIDRFQFLFITMSFCIVASIFLVQFTELPAVILIMACAYLILPAFSALSQFSSVDSKLASQDKDERIRTLRLRPNIFHVILDGYAGNETFTRHNLSNEEFVSFLKNNGFQIPDKSRSNYPQTLVSLPSILNSKYYLNYIDKNPKKDRSRFVNDMRNSNAQSTFLGNDYNVSRYYSIWHSSGCFGVSAVKCRGLEGVILSEFVGAYLQKWPLKWSEIVKIQRYVALNLVAALREHPIDILRSSLRQNVLEYRQQYVFAHLIMPHPPYRYKKDCSVADDWGTVINWGTAEAYFDQTYCLNEKLTDLISDILRADYNAIIILQSDHGPSFSEADANYLGMPSKEQVVEKLGNFVAMRVPEKCGRIPDKLSNVNVYHLLFNCLSDTKVRLQPDRFFWLDDENKIFMLPDDIVY